MKYALILLAFIYIPFIQSQDRDIRTYSAFFVPGLIKLQQLYKKVTPSIIQRYPKTIVVLGALGLAEYIFRKKKDDILIWSLKKNYSSIAWYARLRGAGQEKKKRIVDSNLCAGAAVSGDIETVKQFVEDGGDVNAKTGSQTILGWAMMGSNLDIIQYLVENGAHINAQDDDGVTILQWAILVDHDKGTHITPYLIDKGVDIEDDEALIWAIMQNSTEAVKELLSNNATISNKVISLNAYTNEINEITTYKSNKNISALVDAMTNSGGNNSLFTKHQWLTFALLNKHDQQILYAIKKGYFKPQDILDGLNHRPHMQLDIVYDLLNLLDDNQIGTLKNKATEIGNEKMLTQIKDYQI